MGVHWGGALVPAGVSPEHLGLCAQLDGVGVPGRVLPPMACKGRCPLWGHMCGTGADPGGAVGSPALGSVAELVRGSDRCGEGGRWF